MVAAYPQQQNLTLAQAPTPHADLERKRLQREAWKAYRGEFQRPLKVEPNQPDDNVLVNLCGPIVDKGASWLFGATVRIEATDELKDSGSALQDFLGGLWGDDDDKMSLLSDVGLNGGVCGQEFIKLIPAQGARKYPRLVVLDPQLVRMVTAPDDCSLILAYVLEYPGPGDTQQRQIIARVDPDGLAETMGADDLDDFWTITNYIRRAHVGAWQQAGEQVTWPYPFAPIFTSKNLPNPNESWGTPDLTPDLIDQNRTLIFLFSNLARIIKYHGHPKTWAKGLTAAQISIAVDDLIVLASPDAQLGTLTPMENFDGILKVIATIMSNIDQQSRIPAVALGRQEMLPRLGPISGIALSLMFQPLIEKTEVKRRTYGKLIREVSRAALVLAGLVPIEQMEDFAIGLHWQPLLPADNLAAAQEALLLQQLDVSLATIYARLGLDADDEAAKKEAEDAHKAALAPLPVAPAAVPGQPMPGQPAPAQPAMAAPQPVAAGGRV